MKRCLLLLLVWCGLGAMAQTKKTTTVPTKTSKPATTNNTDKKEAGYEIPITLTPFKNCYVYMGCHYGKGKSLVDSAWLDATSKGVFKGNKKLTGGIYFIVSPQYTIQFEFLMDDGQRFSIAADSSRKEDFVIKGSTENDLFAQYSKLSASKGKVRFDLVNKLSSAKTKADSNVIKDKIMLIDSERNAYMKQVIKQHPTSLLATLFNVLQRPQVPAIPVVNGKADSSYPYRYVKEHFWDEVNFYDDRLLRTPFFEPKVDEYYKYYVSPEPDSIIPEVKLMLLSARTGKEIYPYLLTKFTNKYVNPEYMGQDKVFLYLFNDFYSKGDTMFLDAKSRKMIFDRAYSLMGAQLGEPAAPLNLTDTTGKLRPMYEEKGKFTFVVFWDPHCGHCKEYIPRLDSFYQAKWKAVGVKIYAVYLYNDHVDDWKKFITEHHLQDWTHAYQTEEAKKAEQASKLPGFRQLYDAQLTPTSFLLDENKRIVAKQLSLDQFDDLIATKLKNNKAK